MSRVLRQLDRFWFAEAPAARLAMVRILVGSYAAWLLQFRYNPIVESTRLPASQFQPVGVASFLSAPPPSWVVQALLVLAVIVSVPFVLGLAYRVTGPLFAGLLLSVLTYYASWGSVNHPDALVTAHIFVLGLTRAADAVSLDALFRAWRGGLSGQVSPDRPDPSGAWQYGFALNLLCAVTATSYLLAGIAKVSGPNGWGWGTGEVLLRQVAWDGLRKELLAQPPPVLATFLYEHVWLFALLAVGSLVLELGAPLALLDRRIGYAWALATFPMHWGIYFIMGISFRYYLSGVAYASFFPLERVPIPFRRSIDAALARIAARATSVRVPRLWRPGRSVTVGAMVVVFGVAMFGAGMLAARALASAPTQPSPTATPGARQSTAASPRATPTRTPRPNPTPTGATAVAPAIAADICPEPCDLFRMVWVGDILLGDASQRDLDRHGYTWPFEYVRPLLAGDFVVGNAEAPITTRRERYFAGQQWHYNADPRAARALADVGFGALSFANNHALDRGPEGLQETLENVRAVGIQPFGAGMNDAEAAAPVLVETPYGTVAVLGFTESWRHGAVAGPDQPGTATFSDGAIVGARDAARAAGARWIVAFVHWGDNYAGVTNEQRRVAASFAQAGYDLVIGHQSHLAQRVDIVNGMPVLYSLGNFTFGSPGRYTDQYPGYSVVAKTYLGPDRFRAIELTCIITDNEIVKFQPRPCSREQSETVIRGLGSHVTLRGGIGILELTRSPG